MLHFLFAQAPTAAPQGSPFSGTTTIIWFGAMIVIMYYVMIRPQSKRQKEHQRLIASLKTGDRVVTASGIHGMITNVKDSTVTVKVADNVKIEMEKSAVTNVARTDAPKS
jgi:preprotein translocase subunit YajC